MTQMLGRKLRSLRHSCRRHKLVMQGELIAHSHAYGRNAVGSYSMLSYVKFIPINFLLLPKEPLKKVQNTKKR